MSSMLLFGVPGVTAGGVSFRFGSGVSLDGVSFGTGSGVCTSVGVLVPLEEAGTSLVTWERDENVRAALMQGAPLLATC